METNSKRRLLFGPIEKRLILISLLTQLFQENPAGNASGCAQLNARDAAHWRDANRHFRAVHSHCTISRPIFRQRF
jgi:hypothetical protein